MIKEKLLFAVHAGSVSGHRVGIITGDPAIDTSMQNHCLPIACSHGSWAGKDDDRLHAEAGICVCWESLTDVEEFFAALGFGDGIEGGPGATECPNGLYVYTVEYDPDATEWQEIMVSDDRADEWPWLEGGTLRRPTAEELEPLTRGEAPWGGVVL